MPEMTVNDGYVTFHCFCNFIQKINPCTETQCFHSYDPPKGKTSIEVSYKCGEEVLYKNADHVGKGVIKKIDFDKTKKYFL